MANVSAPSAPSPPYPAYPPASAMAPVGPSPATASPVAGGNAIMPTTKIEMCLSARGLLNKDISSKSDAYCVVKMKYAWSQDYFELGRTETIKDSLNPEWVHKFIIDYNFEVMQYVRFEIWDLDPLKSEFLGEHQTTMGEIVAYASRQFVKPLVGGDPYNKSRKCGEIVVVTEEVSSCKQIVHLKFSAENLPKYLFGLVKPDAFLVLSRSNEDGTWSVVAKSAAARSSSNPHWQPLTNRVRAICNGDYDRTIKIDCYDLRSSGDHILLGTCFTSLRELTTADGQPNLNLQSTLLKQPITIKTNKRFPLAKPKYSQSSPSNKNKQRCLLVHEVTVSEELSFLDFIKTGTQMHFAVAIDFTASNGPPRETSSLHYLDPYGGRPNPYEIALRSVGEIIQQYDTAGMFPAFGFGAKLPPHGEVSHQFPLNGNQAHPYCTNIDDILTHYRNSVAAVTLYGPTNFSPVIQNTAQIASQYQDGKHYFVLLIITDGIISDMHNTMRSIIDASHLPLSIIIVGVGNADFGAMDALDSDDKRLSVDGKYAQRDIVQFVPLNRFLSNRVGATSYVLSQADLAKEVLAEVPDQMTGYMKSKSFMPG